MKMSVITGKLTPAGEPPRSTAYYYGDLERIKRQNSLPEPNQHAQNGIQQDGGKHEFELSEYVEANDVINDGAIREVPPFRDRQYSLPEYSTPEGHKETYSTAGTFPMPEQKEKEPLLAELEIVGRVPLTQLDSGSGVRRSRSWYLCCPNVGDDEISRESSWRYSSLRPVTAPPSAGRLELLSLPSPPPLTSEPLSLRAERDALARALSLERQKSAAAARAHDARLAELHGVIAELVRRAKGREGRAIPEEDLTDECESTTQPAGELDPDTDHSRTEQNETSSLSPDAAPHENVETKVMEETSTEVDHSLNPAVVVASASGSEAEAETSHISDKEYKRCSPASCRRDRGSSDGKLYTSPGGMSSRVAKLASRVRLKRTDDGNSTHLSSDEALCGDVMTAQRLAAEVCAQAELREKIVCAGHDEAALEASASLVRAGAAHAAAENRTLRRALAAAVDNQHRLVEWMAAQESSCVCVCGALRAADRALEAYDVLLALAETRHPHDHPRDHPRDHPHDHTRARKHAENVASALLARLQTPDAPRSLLSPGPWADVTPASGCTEWTEENEKMLREHAARLKADTVTLRQMAPPPTLYTRYDSEEKDGDSSDTNINMAELEEAVALEELTLVRECRAAARVSALLSGNRTLNNHTHQSESSGRRRRRDRHKHERSWMQAPSETQL